MDVTDDEVVEALGPHPDEVLLHMNIEIVIDELSSIPSGVFSYLNKYLNKGV